jgi:hypothetical protein
MKDVRFRTEAKEDIERMTNEITESLTALDIGHTVQHTPNFFESDQEHYDGSPDYAVRINLEFGQSDLLAVGIDPYNFAPKSEQGPAPLAWWDWQNEYQIVVGC